MSCLVSCGTRHRPQSQILSHPLRLSFRRSLQRAHDLRNTMNIYPAMFYGRVADQHKSHLSQVMSPNSSRPKRSGLKTSSREQLSLTRILGQIRINYRKDQQEAISKILSPKTWMNLVKLVPMSYIQSQMHSDYDSTESIADSDLEDGELKKCWLHHCVCEVKKTVNHLKCQLHR